jgi:hypothetical protein
MYAMTLTPISKMVPSAAGASKETSLSRSYRATRIPHKKAMELTAAAGRQPNQRGSPGRVAVAAGQQMPGGNRDLHSL